MITLMDHVRGYLNNEIIRLHGIALEISLLEPSGTERIISRPGHRGVMLISGAPVGLQI